MLPPQVRVRTSFTLVFSTRFENDIVRLIQQAEIRPFWSSHWPSWEAMPILMHWSPPVLNTIGVWVGIGHSFRFLLYSCPTPSHSLSTVHRIAVKFVLFRIVGTDIHWNISF